MPWVLEPLSGAVHKLLIDLIRSVLDLLLSLLGLTQDRPWLRDIIAINPFEQLLSVLIALVHNPDNFDQIWSFGE